MGELPGYARVSTLAQDAALQHDSLSAAGCFRTWTDTASGPVHTTAAPRCPDRVHSRLHRRGFPHRQCGRLRISASAAVPLLTPHPLTTSGPVHYVVAPQGHARDDEAMPTPDPQSFSQAWLEAFNAHDLEALLSHFAGDVVFTTPVAARALPETGGVVGGIDALRAYWTLALEKVPDLHFELLGVYTGIDTLVPNYRNQAGGQACEVLTLRGDLVSEGHSTYLGASAQAGGAPTTSGR